MLLLLLLLLLMMMMTMMMTTMMMIIDHYYCRRHRPVHDVTQGVSVRPSVLLALRRCIIVIFITIF